MKVKLPFIGKPVGLGDAVKAVTSSVGVKPCGGCNKRADSLNAAVTFVPVTVENPMLTARMGEPYSATLPGVVIGGSIPPGMRVDPVTKLLSGTPQMVGAWVMVTKGGVVSMEVQ